MTSAETGKAQLEQPSHVAGWAWGRTVEVRRSTRCATRGPTERPGESLGFQAEQGAQSPSGSGVQGGQAQGGVEGKPRATRSICGWRPGVYRGLGVSEMAGHLRMPEPWWPAGTGTALACRQLLFPLIPHFAEEALHK